MKSRHAFAFALCVALGAAGRATSAPQDPIDVDGATISVGTAPTLGAVVIDPAAGEAPFPDVPTIEPLPGPGTFFTSMPAAPNLGSGGGAFAATTSQTLAAGTHQFATFDIAPGVVVTATGAVTILVTGNASVRGSLVSASSIDLSCGGDLVLGAGALMSSDVGGLTLDAAGDVQAGAGSTLSTWKSALTVRARGTSGGPGDVTLTGSSLGSVAGTLLVQSARSFTAADNAYVGTVGSDVIVQAFGGDATFTGGSGAHATGAPNGVRAEAAGSVTITGSGTEIGQTSGLIRVRAFGGTLDLTDGAEVRLTGGDVDLGATGSVRITDTARVRMTSGTIRVTSFEADVELSPSGGADCLRTTVGLIDVEAAKNVRFEGDGTVGSTGGDLRAAAHDGDLVLGSGASVSTSGRLDLLANGALKAQVAKLRALDGIAFVAGAGGIELDVDSDVTAQAGTAGFRAVATGPVTVHGRLLVHDGDLLLASRDGAVDVAGSTLTTMAAWFEVPGTGGPSPSISIESFAGATGHIAAAGATIRSGDSDVLSGDVRLVIHDGATAVAAQGFVAPDAVRVIARPARPARSTIDASGWFDAGIAGPLKRGTATLSVGGVEETVTVRRVGSRGAVRLSGKHVSMDVQAPRNGSSRARFRLAAKRDHTRFLSTGGSGAVVIGLTAGTLDARTVVHLDRWKFRRAGARGALAAPRIYPARCEVRSGADGSDVLVAEVALGDLGDAPAAAPDVVVRFGPTFVARVPGTAFAASGGSTFTATAPVAGVRSVTLDFARGVISIEANAADMGVSPSGRSLPAVVAVGLGRAERAVQVRLGRSQRGFRY